MKLKLPKKSEYRITVFTKDGEELVQLKINPKKRHSAKNTIVGWNIYKDGLLHQIFSEESMIYFVYDTCRR